MSEKAEKLILSNGFSGYCTNCCKKYRSLLQFHYPFKIPALDKIQSRKKSAVRNFELLKPRSGDRPKSEANRT